ncbi:MAG TPA: TonB-dependent receptor, partial [Candidatus Acidoferrales bacterium]|nr:TonB-dependent receptor [Candidatus Acidoferrales bacterium]
VPNPFETLNQNRTNGYAFNASVGHNKHTFTLTGNIESSNSDFTPLTLTPYVIHSGIGINAKQLNFTDSIKSTDKLNLNFNASVADTSGVGDSVLGGGGATWRPTGNDTMQLALNLGSAQPPPTTPRTFSDPTTARFNCDAGTSIVSGPGDTTAQQQSSTSYNLDWTHLWRTGQITVNAFRQTQIGQTINALVNADGEPPDYFPAGYIGSIGQTWSAPTICGSTPFNPSGVYVNEPIAGTARAYQGVDISGRIALGPNVVMLPTYTLNDAVLLAADSRLTSAQSTSIVGEQLPGRPIHRAGITFDAELPQSGFELLANAQYTGTNNNRYLDPYTTVAWGISHAFGPGRLTLFETNAFNAESGEFSTLLYANPVPVSGGGVVFFAANPLLPRTISLNYTVAVGKGAQKSPSTLASAARMAERAAGGGPGGGGPNVGGPGGFRGPGGGPGGFHRNVLPVGGDPFALATDNPLCNAEAQEIAKPLLDGLRAYVTAYENKQPLPPTGEYTVIAHTTAPGSAVPYWLEIRPQLPPGGPPGGPRRFQQQGSSKNVAISGAPEITPSPGASPVTSPTSAPSPQPSGSPGERRRGEGPERFRAIIACEYIAVLTPDEAKAKGIDTNGRVFMGYAPGIGIFGVQPRQLPQGGGSLRGD